MHRSCCAVSFALADHLFEVKIGKPVLGKVVPILAFLYCDLF